MVVCWGELLFPEVHLHLAGKKMSQKILDIITLNTMVGVVYGLTRLTPFCTYIWSNINPPISTKLTKKKKNITR